MRIKLLYLVPTLTLVNACSSDFTPDPKATGEEIYQAACKDCHQPDEQGHVFTINKKNANATYVAHKVRSGSIMMPAFNNMKANDLKKLSAFVLEKAKIE